MDKKKKKIFISAGSFYVCSTLVQDKFPYWDKKVYRFLSRNQRQSRTMSSTLMIRPLVWFLHIANRNWIITTGNKVFPNYMTSSL